MVSTPCRAASTHGPESVTYSTWSASEASGSVLATVRKRPWRSIVSVQAACSATCSPARSTTVCRNDSTVVELSRLACRSDTAAERSRRSSASGSGCVIMAPSGDEGNPGRALSSAEYPGGAAAPYRRLRSLDGREVVVDPAWEQPGPRRGGAPRFLARAAG